MPQIGGRLIGPAIVLAAFVAGCSAISQVPVRHSEPRKFVLVPVAINGIAATFLLDTGTPETVVSREFADRAGIHGDRYATLRSFRVGPVKATREIGQLLIADLPQHGEPAGTDVAGILGNGAWSSADYVLDVRQPSLGLSRDLSLSASPEAKRLKASGGKTYLPVEIDGRTFDFLLDTGTSATHVNQETIDAVRPGNSDYLQMEITTNGSTEYRNIPALHAEVRVGLVLIPQFSFLVGKENVIGLNILRYGELSVSMRVGMFIFRNRVEP